MARRKKQTRLYIQYSRAAIKPMLFAIDAFNRVHGDYKLETTLILLVNAWELLAKAILIKRKQDIYRDKKKTQSISCEESLNILFQKKDLDKNQVDLLQQVVSLRNHAMHALLPSVPDAVQHHLFFFSCKFFKDLVAKNFRDLEPLLNKNFLTLSFDSLTTYASQIQSAISKLRRSNNGNKELVWLLERGLRYVDNSSYISQKDFEELYKGKKKIMPHLEIGDHLEKADMICVVPIQAPKNFTADINLRKGPKDLKGALPVTIKKSTVDEDFPYLTSNLAEEISKNQSFTAKMVKVMNLKGNSEFHQKVKTGKTNFIHRYSEKELDTLKARLKSDSNFNPYKQVTP